VAQDDGKVHPYYLFVLTLQIVDSVYIVKHRENREGWPLLTRFETEVNGDSKSIPWLFRWAYRAGTRYFCPALASIVDTISIYLSSPPSKLDTVQAAVLGRLSLIMCLWSILSKNYIWSNLCKNYI
jgi:hypothetical protein